jgi:hypothetical protein
MPRFHLVLADAILLAHALIIAFNVFSLPLIWVGYFRRWRFVRNFYFRTIHLVMIGYIAAQALLGEICPLTNWENNLRVQAGTDPRYATSFVGHWLQRLIFYEADERSFLIAYVIFFALVLLTLILVKPDLPHPRRSPR